MANNENINSRYNFLMGFIGDNRTGKSATAIRRARIWRQSRDPHKFKVIAFDPQDRFKSVPGLVDHYIDRKDPEWAIKLSKTKNKLIIIDDIRLLNKSWLPAPGLEDLLIDRAKNNVDIIYICHNPSLVLNILTYYTSHWFIFSCNVQQGGFKKKIPNYHLCNAALIAVNEYVKDLDPMSFYPNFPYAIVEKNTGRVNLINFQNNINNFKK